MSDFPQVEAKILHPLTEPDIPNIGPGSFEKMVPQYVVDALARYHSFAQGELDKLIQSIEGYNKQLEQVKENLHVDNVVWAINFCEGCRSPRRSPRRAFRRNTGSRFRTSRRRMACRSCSRSCIR